MSLKFQGIVIMGSAKGGMDIETVAKEEPSAIKRINIPIGGNRLILKFILIM